MSYIVVANNSDGGVYAFGTKETGKPFLTEKSASLAAEKLEKSLGYRINGAVAVNIIPHGAYTTGRTR